MIEENGFEVRVLAKRGGEDVIDRNGRLYVGLDSGTEYKLELRNDRDTMCDAVVELEGERVGMWRIYARDTIVIERPVDTKRKFTFFEEDSYKAREAGVRRGSANNGLVKVTFYPKKRGFVYETARRVESKAMMEESSPSMRALSYKSGATVLGDRSYQKFRVIPALRPDEIEWRDVTEILFRLVAREEESRYVSVGGRKRRSPRYPPRI